jgi:transglutaminase-like putative cysteine protease
MYDIRQFKPSLYLLLIMGMSGFALAAQSPGIWVLSVAGILLNAWLCNTNRFRPMPRLVANVITVIALLWAFQSLRRGGTAAILVIGQFLVLLQLVKLYEQRGNRDFAQLLVLSLLLMVAAAINTASLAFGVLFICYLFLSLYCCLLFHLKVETDHAKAAIGLPEEKLNPMTLRQDQRYLSRSMRRLTMLVSFVSIATAVMVFLFFPRNTGAGLLGPLSARQPQTLTGFSEKVSFQQVAQITQNNAIVAYVKLWRDGRAVEGGTEPLLLRGVSLDLYTGNGLAQSYPMWQWLRSMSATTRLEINADHHTIQLADRDERGSIRQEIMLQPASTDVLFALAGPTDVTPVGLDGAILYTRRDEAMKIEPAFDKNVRYEVFSTGRLTSATPPATTAPATESQSPEDQSATPDGRGLLRSVIDPQIDAYAHRPEVGGADPSGAPLVAQRPKESFVTPLDQQIAANIERHLQGPGFSYTLDLTDARGIGQDRDPLAAFLTDFKRGHCEYFAGAMTLMCQSLGMQARMVVGFKCDEFNNLTDSFVVRQSHAHAWVEVLNEKGEWITFDPTSGRDARNRSATSGAWRKIKQLFDYLEYTWANSVVAYDRDARNNVINNVENKLGKTTEDSLSAVKNTRDWFDKPLNWFNFSSGLISVLIWLLLIVLAVSVGWFAYERWKIRQRVRRIGLEGLSHGAQLRLARQLGFYDDLLLLLSRHHISCPPHLTPREFSESVSFLPNELFDAIRRITDIFYRIRYGQVAITNAQQRHLKNVIGQIEQGLASVPKRHSPRIWPMDKLRRS